MIAPRRIKSASQTSKDVTEKGTRRKQALRTRDGSIPFQSITGSAPADCAIPSTLTPLKQYISTEIPQCLSHPNLAGSWVLLPGLGDLYGSNLPRLPDLHDCNEDYPYTHVLPEVYVHKPKKYTHPFFEKMKTIKGCICNHTEKEFRIDSLSGENIYRRTIDKKRDKSEVRDEILELERLMKGLSTDWGKSTVVLYQNEINNLKKMIKTMMSSIGLAETPPETPDPTGLRKFFKEYDTAFQALQDRHMQCMFELLKIEEMEQLMLRAQKLDIGQKNGEHFKKT